MTTHKSDISWKNKKWSNKKIDLYFERKTKPPQRWLWQHLWPRFATSTTRRSTRSRRPLPVATRLASSSSTCLCPPPPTRRPRSFSPLHPHPREALAPLRYRCPRRLGASAPARVPFRPPKAPSLQSDLAEFPYQQHCNFLQYRKAIAVLSLIDLQDLVR